MSDLSIQKQELEERLEDALKRALALADSSRVERRNGHESYATNIMFQATWHLTTALQVKKELKVLGPIRSDLAELWERVYLVMGGVNG